MVSPMLKLSIYHFSHDRNNVEVILGEHDRSENEGTEEAFIIECLFIHKNYRPHMPYHHDIAMIKLDAEGNADGTEGNILPVCLPETGEFEQNDICYITGWGYTGL